MAEESCRSKIATTAVPIRSSPPLVHWTVLLEGGVEISAVDGDVDVENVGDGVIRDCSSEREVDTGFHSIKLLALAVRTSQGLLTRIHPQKTLLGLTAAFDHLAWQKGGDANCWNKR